MNKLLQLAREDLRAEAARLERSAPAEHAEKSGALLLPLGVGAWTKLRDILNPWADTTARVWQRLASTPVESAAAPAEGAAEGAGGASRTSRAARPTRATSRLYAKPPLR